MVSGAREANADFYLNERITLRQPIFQWKVVVPPARDSRAGRAGHLGKLHQHPKWTFGV